MRVALLNLIGTRWLTPPRRAAAYRALGIPTGAETLISMGVTLMSRLLTIGRGGYVGTRCHFDNHAPVTLGDDVWVGEQTTFITMTHEIGGPERRAGLFRSEPIEVHDGVWIGARCTILPGVTIGRGVIVAAGSVVREDCEPDHLYAGVPAVRKRRLDAEVRSAPAPS